ncbi:hypothetical protein BDR03DRAFT_383766 [Suillus americanus]|nr:hypothetical protein BDR03DRAFT_383766 [Suillus americanus]
MSYTRPDVQHRSTRVLPVPYGRFRQSSEGQLTCLVRRIQECRVYVFSLEASGGVALKYGGLVCSYLNVSCIPCTWVVYWLIT